MEGEPRQRLPVAAVLFDLDNTLVSTRGADAKTCNKIVNILTDQYGVPHDYAVGAAATFLETFRRCPDSPEYDLDMWRIHLWNEALGEEYCHLGNDIYLQWLELRYHYMAVKPDIQCLLMSLRQKYLIGLITNGPSRAQWEKIDRLQLSNYFDCILVSGDLPWEKPDQRIFMEACHYLRVEPKHCIMVGDKLETDILGGKMADLAATVWVPLSKDEIESVADITPDFTIDTVAQLPDVLHFDSFRSDKLTQTTS